MKKNLIILLILIGIILPLKVNALSGSISLSCNPSTIKPGATSTCTLSGYGDSGVAGVDAKVSTSGNISLVSINTSTSWQGNGDGNHIGLYSDTDKTGSFPIATIVVKGTSEGTGTVSIYDVKFADGATYKNVVIGGKSSTITVKNPTPANTNTTKPSTNTNTTKPSTNTNTTKPTTNTTNTDKEENKKSNDATLKSITLSSGKINFKATTYEYNVEVGNDVEELKVTAVKNNDKAVVTLPTNTKLNVGKNDLKIQVKAEDGTVKTYTLHVVRLNKVLSNNSKLAELKVDGKTIKLESNTYSYDLEKIDGNIVDIVANAESDKAEVKIYGNNSVGLNDSVIVKVTAEDGTVSEYILYVSGIDTENKCNTNSSAGIIVFLILLVISILLNIFLLARQKKLSSN